MFFLRPNDLILLLCPCQTDNLGDVKVKGSWWVSFVHLSGLPSHFQGFNSFRNCYRTSPLWLCQRGKNSILLKQKGCYSCPQILLPYIWTQLLELLRRERQHFSSLNLLQKVKEYYNPLTIFGEWEGLFWCSQLYCIDKIVDYIQMWSLKSTGKINLHILVKKNLSASFA